MGTGHRDRNKTGRSRAAMDRRGSEEMNKKDIKAFAKDVAKKNAVLREMMRAALQVKRRAKYRRHTKGCVTDDKTIVFSTFNGRSYGCTPKAVFLYMQQDERFRDYHFIWSMKDPEKHQYLNDFPNTRVVKDNSPEYDRALGTAKYWFFNYRIYDHIYPRKDQVYIQCWHGTPLKRLGYDLETTDNAMNNLKEIRKKYRTDAEKFSYILSPSPFCTDKFGSAWNLKETGQTDKIVEVGYPRDDYMYNYTEDEAAAVRKALGLPEDKKILLYAPTWRDNQHDSKIGYVYRNEVDFDRLREALQDEYVILFRAHYLVANSFDFEKYKGFIYDVSHYDDINELYVISDLLVTDYSSVFFDYANLKRPIIFYMYDLEYYKDELRGFYLDLSELPGPITTDEEGLIKAVKDTAGFRYDEAYAAFNERFNGLNDGHAAKRLAERVIFGE